MRSGLRHALERAHQEEGAARAVELAAAAAEAPVPRRPRKKSAKARKSARR